MIQKDKDDLDAAAARLHERKKYLRQYSLGNLDLINSRRAKQAQDKKAVDLAFQHQIYNINPRRTLN